MNLQTHYLSRFPSALGLFLRTFPHPAAACCLQAEKLDAIESVKQKIKTIMMNPHRVILWWKY